MVRPVSEVPEELEVLARRRWASRFGWVAGVSLALVVNYGLFARTGPTYPLRVATFVAVVVGGFGGLALGDRLGPRGFRPLALAAGIGLSILLLVVLTALGGGG
jgi:hypothetical protein